MKTESSCTMAFVLLRELCGVVGGNKGACLYSSNGSTVLKTLCVRECVDSHLLLTININILNNPSGTTSFFETTHLTCRGHVSLGAHKKEHILSQMHAILALMFDFTPYPILKVNIPVYIMEFRVVYICKGLC